MYNLMYPLTYSVITGLLLLTLTRFNSPNFAIMAKNTVLATLIISILPILFMPLQENMILIGQKPGTETFFHPNLNIYFDQYFIMFLPMALFVTLNILKFALWGMKESVNKTYFIKYLLIFLLMIIITTSAGNFLTFFIGWQGMNLLSFLMASWFPGLNNSATTAWQTIRYSLFGDIGLFVTFCWFLKMLNTSMPPSTDLSPPTFILMVAISAAAAKFAQFSFLPWSALTIKNPAPVPTFLHSTTSGVAGIFLLLRLFPYIEKNQYALTTCLCLGAGIMLVPALLALMQNDIKMIMTHSTSNQLGMMMVAIGINQPHLAFLLICTHTFFKAVMFLSTNIISINLCSEWDLRKMGGFQLAMLIMTSCLSISALSLTLGPLLMGLYFTDAIIESASTSTINATALLLFILASTLTTTYSLRLVYYISFIFPRTRPLMNFNEKKIPIFIDIIWLTLTGIMIGWTFFHTAFPYTSTSLIPTHLMKIMALAATLPGYFIIPILAKRTWNRPLTKDPNPKTYEIPLYHQTTHHPTTIIVDSGWMIILSLNNKLAIKKFNLDSLCLPFKPAHKISRAFQHSLIKAYVVGFLTTFMPIMFLTWAYFYFF